MEKAERIWLIAKKRASFKKHLFTYLVINAFLWLSWFYSGDEDMKAWPIYTTLGWGIGLAFHYFSAYYGIKEDLIQKEYDELMKKEKGEKDKSEK